MNSKDDVWNRYARTLRRRQQLDRAGEWLRAHPIWNWAIGIVFTIAVLFLAMFVKWLAVGCWNCDPLNR